MLRAELHKDDTIVGNNITLKGKGSVVSSYCRELIKQGYADQPLELYRKDTKCLVVKSILKQSKLTLNEDKGLYYIKYVPCIYS